ncbi:MAG TPA: ABC transporter permease, partial [Myxococcaceae bacterium]|nr:ABC transporter permease [Myxococcaceae bacterium]
MNAERQTEYRPFWLIAGGLVAAAGAAWMSVVLLHSGALQFLWAELGVASLGWGTPMLVLQNFGASLQLAVAGRGAGVSSAGPWLWAGAGVFVVGWGLVAAGIRRAPADTTPPSEAVGAPLHPRLARYRDFYWSTLLAYGGGFLAAELVLVVVHTALVVGVRPGGSLDPASGIQLAPPWAFAVAALVASGVAFAAGFLGASRAGRLAAPEATLAILYFGTPLPVLLTALSASPQLDLQLGYRLREITYLAGLIGRPELGYWLVFNGLVLVLILGITSGFVATGSGRVDLRAGFELFVARRHAAVFRPGLLFLVLGVLVLGILPPILIVAMVRAAEAAVERTRIRQLGQADPLKATRALFRQRSKEPSPTDTMTALSVGGVGVGVMALIIVLSVMSGFEADLQEKILGTNAHAVVQKYDTDFPEWHDVMKTIAQVPGIKGQTPFIYNEVMLTSEGNIAGTIIKGIDPATVGSVSDLPRNVSPPEAIGFLSHPDEILSAVETPQEEEGDSGSGPEKTGKTGKIDDPLIRIGGKGAKAPALPGIIIGRELASQLKVLVGDRVNVVSPLGGELGPQGPMPKSRPFRVAGIFYSGMYEYDSKFVYILLDEAQHFFNVKGVTGIELKVENVDDARRISREVLSRLKGYPYRTRDWGEMNKNLFSALRLEKLVMGIILSVIVIIAAGLIVATVIMLVLEKRKEISVLKALGVPDGGIVKIFLAEGLQIGIAGGILGLLSGLWWCKAIEVVGIKL